MTAPRAKDADGRKFAFAAPTLDGALMLTNGVPASGSPIRGLEGDFPTKLLDTKTGQAVTAPSLTALVKYALTPVFSPDGKRVAFNHFDTGAGKTLAVMDFDGSQSPPLFSNLCRARPTALPRGARRLQGGADGEAPGRDRRAGEARPGRGAKLRAMTVHVLDTGAADIDERVADRAAEGLRAVKRDRCAKCSGFIRPSIVDAIVMAFADQYAQPGDEIIVYTGDMTDMELLRAAAFTSVTLTRC
jgi:hypothetical protein